MIPEEPSVSKETENTETKPKKPPKRGIIYLSSLPPYMNVMKIREVFSEFGTLGRVYLQLADKEDKQGKKKTKNKKKLAKKFTEGWVEFERKSVAKKVAQLLNNQQVSTRKKSKQYDCIWNIKYLSGFKWAHLHERLAYEKAANRQKIRSDIQQVKKRTNYFAVGLDKQKKKKGDSGGNKNVQGNKQENRKEIEGESSEEEVERSGIAVESMF